MLQKDSEMTLLMADILMLIIKTTVIYLLLLLIRIYTTVNFVRLDFISLSRNQKIYLFYAFKKMSC